jgi:hypothetical protein
MSRFGSNASEAEEKVRILLVQVQFGLQKLLVAIGLRLSIDRREI